MKKKYQVLIIGAGKMGSSFDDPGSLNFLTHAHGFSSHSGFNLLGFVDIDKKQAEAAAKKWGVKYFKSVKEAFEQSTIDIVCIATLAETHYKIIKEILSHPVQLVLLEKPLAKTIDETKKIMELCRQSKKSVVVNYFRRFLPEFEKIKANIDKNTYGNFVSGVGYYGKGMLNNGSHVINLLNYFFGGVSDFNIIDRYVDFSAQDETVSSILTLKNKKPFILKGVNSKLFTLLEIDLIFEKQRIRIVDSGRGMEFFQIKASPVFKGYENLVKTSEIKTSFNRYMYYVVDNIYKNLTKSEKIKCDISDAYKTSEVCFKILNHK